MPDPRKKFEESYDRYSDAIFRYLYFRLGDRERSLELTQEVFARFWQYLRKGHDVGYPRSFLYRSAANIFINEIRVDKATVSLDNLLDSGQEIPDSRKDETQNKFLQQEVVDKILKVDSPYRDVLLMRYTEDMPVKDIAKILNQKENTISVWIKRGVEKLKKIYEQP